MRELHRCGCLHAIIFANESVRGSPLLARVRCVPSPHSSLVGSEACTHVCRQGESLHRVPPPTRQSTALAAQVTIAPVLLGSLLMTKVLRMVRAFTLVLSDVEVLE
jgi:hypothetical protein